MKQRVVGTVVVVCIAIIFVPMLLDGEGMQSPELEMTVPPMPSSSAATASGQVAPSGGLPTPILPPAPDPIAALDEPADSDATQAAIQIETPAPEQTAAPEQGSDTNDGKNNNGALNETGLLAGWSVRLGTFGNAGNAEGLMRTLRADGHKAYTRTIRRESGNLTAVLVGPLLARDEASSLRDRLARTYNLDGMVVAFDVTTVE